MKKSRLGTDVSHYRGKETSRVGNLIKLDTNINLMFEPSTISAQQFIRDKAEILERLKKEAEENVLKEKVLASIKHSKSPLEVQRDLTNLQIRKFPPQQCVLLKPVLTESSLEKQTAETIERLPPPIIIPGDPEKSIKLLQGKEGRDLIQEKLEKQANEIPLGVASQAGDEDREKSKNTESTTAIILPTLSALEDHGANGGKQEGWEIIYVNTSRSIIMIEL